MDKEFNQRFARFAYAALRIAAGLTYFSHGAQKFLGWFGGFGPDGGTAELMSRFGAAGIIETVCGLALVLGLFTRPLALLAAGEMAVAYFWIHSAEGEFLWWQNHGEIVLVYSFLWLLYAANGAGPFSMDGWLARRKAF